MRKKTVLMGGVFLALLGTALFAWDSTKLEVFKYGDTAFKVRNVTAKKVKDISIAIDIQRPGGPACVYWHPNNDDKSLPKFGEVTVDVIKDMGERQGTTIKNVKPDYCD